MKKALSIVTAAALSVTMLAGCSSAPAQSGTSDGASSSATSETSGETTTGEVTTIRFYGSDADYNRNIIAGFEAENPDITNTNSKGSLSSFFAASMTYRVPLIKLIEPTQSTLRTFFFAFSLIKLSFCFSVLMDLSAPYGNV